MGRLSSMARRPAVPGTLPMVAILLLGGLLRCLPLQQNRAMEDEALYGYWGLQIASGSDPVLDREPVDKPPLFPYTLALSFLFFGPAREQTDVKACSESMPIVGGPLACRTPSCSVETQQLEMVSRLPSLFASILAIALLYRLGRTLYRSRSTGLLAALLLALSPFAVLFGPTAFVDPLLTTWVLSALIAATAGHPGAAGILAGLAAATKQQGLLFVPLVAAVGLLMGTQTGASGTSSRWSVLGGGRLRRSWAACLVFLLGFSAPAAATGVWDQARVQRPGFFAQSVISYGGLGLAPVSDLVARARAWLHLLGSYWASPWLNGIFVATLLAAVVAGLLRGARCLPAACPNAKSSTHVSVSSAILLFTALFLLAHWLLEVRIWDRYLLVIQPLVALLIARAFRLAGQVLPAGRWRAAYGPLVAFIVMVSLAGPLIGSLKGRVPIGGDHGAYDGIDDLAAYARSQLPSGSVLYDHWLGHHYRFYLYGAPLQIHWYPDLPDLTRDALARRQEQRYIAFPSWREEPPAVRALTSAGIDLAPVYETLRRDGSVSFRLYRLVGP